MYGYSHFFVFAGITATAVGAEAAILGAPEQQLSAGAALALGAGLVAFLLGTTALQWAAPGSLPHTIIWARLAMVVLVGLVAAIGQTLGPTLAVAALALGFVALSAYETTHTWRPASHSELEAAQPAG